MPTNDILEFCNTDTGTNLLSEAEYTADAQRVIGNQPGIARSKLINKAIRQATLMAAALAQVIVNKTGQSVLDNSDIATIITNLTTALTTVVPDASTTVKGIVELATDAETAAGVDTVRAVTPAGAASVYTKGVAASVNRELPLFSGTDGKTLQRETGSGVLKVVSGVVQTPSTIVAADIASDAVTTAKILGNNVTLAKLATQAASTVLMNATASSAVPTAVALSASQLVGRGATGNGGAITLGTGLSFSGTTLNAASGLVVREYFYTSSTTYTPNANMLYCDVQLSAGGGGGAAGDSTSGSAGGGGGGYAAKIFSKADIGASKAVVIGAGGAATVAGGDSTFGSTLLMAGGGGAASSKTPGAGGTATAGTRLMPGAIGQGGQTTNGFLMGGSGGGCILGAGGGGGKGGSGAGGTGGTGGGFGGGGGGGGGGSGAGGAGSGGVCIIIEYCSA